MTTTRNCTIKLDRPMEEIYLREGQKTVEGKIQMVYVASRNGRCDYCEFPLSNQRKHPLVDGEVAMHRVCGDYVVRLT